MKARNAFALAATLMLVTAPSAGADDVESYLEILANRGITHNKGEGTLVQVGMEICDLIESGMAPIAVAEKVYYETPASISSGDAGYIVGAAIAGLCPEYLYLAREYA